MILRVLAMLPIGVAACAPVNVTGTLQGDTPRFASAGFGVGTESGTNNGRLRAVSSAAGCDALAAGDLARLAGDDGWTLDATFSSLAELDGDYSGGIGDGACDAKPMNLTICRVSGGDARCFVAREGLLTLSGAADASVTLDADTLTMREEGKAHEGTLAIEGSVQHCAALNAKARFDGQYPFGGCDPLAP